MASVAERARVQAKLLLIAVLGVHGGGQRSGRRSPSSASRRAGSRPRTSISSGRCRWSPRSSRCMLWRWLGRGRDDAAVPGVDRAVPARLSRPGDLDLPVSRAADADDLADRGRAGEPDLHADRHGRRCCRSSSATSCSCTGCSAARCARARAIIDRRFHTARARRSPGFRSGTSPSRSTDRACVPIDQYSATTTFWPKR